MLVKKVLENQAFNSSQVAQNQNTETEMKAKKNKKPRCFICRERGHAYWSCEQRKKLAAIEVQQETSIDRQMLDEETKFPEKINMEVDYMIQGSDDKTWNEVWFVSSAYKHHLCPSRIQFKRIDYKFKMIFREEKEKKFVFSYGLGDAVVNTKDGDILVQDVQYTPEVSINILSYDLLEEQGYKVRIENNMCILESMFDENKMETEEKQETDKGQKWSPIREHNSYLDNYFETLDPKDECSLVKGIEELNWNKEDTQDYVDNDYISWNGTLYALKVNSFNRFLSFMNLLKKNSLVYNNWEVFSGKFVELIKWFYLVHLNYDEIDMIPPIIEGKEIDLLSLHKIVDGFGGYVEVTLSDKWRGIACILDLPVENGEAIKACYRKFIDLVSVYHETARMPSFDKTNEVGECSKNAEERSPQDWKKGAVHDGSQEEEMNNHGERQYGNVEEDASHSTSSQGSSDYEIIA